VVQFQAGESKLSALQTVQSSSRAKSVSYSGGTKVSSSVGSGHRMNLTTYMYLVPRLRMHGDILPLPHMPLWHPQGLPFYFTNLLPSVNNRNATESPWR